MYDIPTQEWTKEFAECWRAAGIHLQQQAEYAGVELVWLKAKLEPPFLEHLSFRLGNQLFFVQIRGVGLQCPGTVTGLKAIAAGCKGHACILPMTDRPTGWWNATFPQWGLIDIVNHVGVNPPLLVTDEVVEMTDWEIHDFAVQVVRQQIEKDGHKIMSSQGNPSVDPSIWFVGDKGPEWVVVRAVRYPLKAAAPPGNWAAIAAGCSKLSNIGHFASVPVASADESSEKGMLRRGGPMHVSFKGLSQIS